MKVLREARTSLFSAGTRDVPVTERLGISAFHVPSRVLAPVCDTIQGPTRCNEVTVAREACCNNNKGVRSGAFGEFGVTEAEAILELIAQNYE
jgi:hypothetical protein